MSDEGEILIKGFSKERAKLMLARGVPGQDMIPKKAKIDVTEALVKMDPNIPRVLPKGISTGKQLRALTHILENPLRGSYTVGIGSFPSDLRAKYMAQTIMDAAIDAYNTHRRPGRSLPLWHRVYGGLTDNLRDKPIQEMPCMLILSNVNEGSSNFKLEKVRDLLEKFSEIPRIVITGGEPPCDLFANKLYYPMRYGIYLGPSNAIREV
jgi:hypothetical protein